MLYTILKHSHSGLRWLVLVALVYGLFYAFVAWKKQVDYTNKDRKLYLAGMTIVHLQLVLGFILYGLAWGSKVDFGQMGNAMVRFYTVEHSFMMLVAVVFVSIGYSRAKRSSSAVASWKGLCIFWGLGLLLILLAIPWPFRESLGAAWF